MNFVQILGTCPSELIQVVKIIKWVINVICWAIPIILIILSILDIAKIVTAGNIDDKLKKEVTGRITTRLIFAVIIFLIPSIVRLIFNVIPITAANGTDKNAQVEGATWGDCWDQA